MRYIYLLLIVFVASNGYPQKVRNEASGKNVIKLNLISSLIYQKGGVATYERVINPNQTFAISIGYLEFPKLASFNSGIHVKEELKKGGSVFGGEYRFYLRNENKYSTPHGVFIGPYSNYFSFKNHRKLTSADELSEAILKSDIHVFNIGFQVGYQFVIRNRWAIEMVFFGPSISRYSMKLGLDGNLNDSESLENDIVSGLADRFPFVEDLLDGETINLNGKSDKWSAGFRYQLNVGYFFGR